MVPLVLFSIAILPQDPLLKLHIKINKNTMSKEKVTKKLSITSTGEFGIKIRIIGP